MTLILSSGLDFDIIINMVKKEVLVFLIFLIGCALSCPDNCNDCDPSGNFCFACKQKYQLSVFGKCVSNLIDRCIVYGPNEKCFVCQPSFELAGNGERCVKQYTGCVNKNANDGSCFQCAFGRFLQNNICVGNINCMKPQFPCQACATGYDLANGQCVDRTAGCQTVRSNDGLCSKCKTGFKLMGYRCVQQRIIVPYCYVYYEQNACQRCKNGYSFFQSYCLLPAQIQAILQGTTTTQRTIAAILVQMGISNVSTTTTGTQTGTSGTSTTTSGGTSTTTTTTITTIIVNGSSSANAANINTNTNNNMNASSITNCVRINNGMCQQCSVGYLVANGTCRLMDINCNSYELDTGRCVSCAQNFDLLNGQCIRRQPFAQIINCQVQNPANPTTCLICQFGFFPSGNTCARVSQFCDGHNVQNGNCFNCLFGLRLNSGKCIDPNCLALSGQRCTTCNTSYILNSNGVCQFNDPNCVTLRGNVCDACRAAFYVNTRGTCLQLPVNCRFANIQVEGLCIQCNDGFTVSNNGGCIASQTSQVIIANCNSVQNGVCVSCVSGFFVRNNTCARVSALCSTSNPSSGLCTGCINGYTLINGICYDLNCLNQVDDRCLECKINFRVVAPSILCTYFDPNCASLTPIGCSSCRAGFIRGMSGLCEVSNTNSNTGSNTNNAGPSTNTNTNTNTGTTITTGGVSDSDRDPNCKEYLNGKCSACSNRHFAGTDGKCVPVNPLCKDYNLVGNCTSCYPGFSLINGVCSAARDVDPYCKTRNANSVCVQCFSGFYINTGKCTGLNPLCRSSNSNGQCTSCYPGYVLAAGACSVSFRDPNCQQFNNASLCVRCASRFFYNSLTTTCQSVNVLCKDFNSVSGVCTNCYDGYRISGGACVVGTATNSDVNCKTLNANGLCLECYSGFFVRVGKCQAINLLCRTSNIQTGVCLSCYPGYSLFNGQCRIPTLAQQGDANCRQFSDNARKICKICFDGNYVKNGLCLQFNVFCKTSNKDNGACQSCYDGYSISQGDCVLTQVAVSSNSDPYCINRQGAACLKCAAGYFLSQTRICEQVNPLCRTSNQITGDCVSCYEGYQMNGRTCVLPVIVNIPFCNIISAAGACVDCIEGYFVRDGQCRAVSILCGATYSKLTGQCTGCIGGYFLQGGQCIFPAFGIDPACERYLNGFCDKCSLGFYLKSYVCTQINRFCTQFDYSRSTCSKCFNRTPQGAECV